MSDLILSYSPAVDFGADFIPQLVEKTRNAVWGGVSPPQKPHEHFVVTKRDETGHYAGALYGLGSQNWLYIHLMFVEPHLRGRGIGSEFLKAAEVEIRGRDYAGIMLFAYDPPAPFYLKNGFTISGTFPNRPRPETEYMLTKILNS